MARAGFYAIPSQKLEFRKDGHWYANGERVTHERLARFFSRHLRRKPDGSGYEIWFDDHFHADVEVEDTPFVVTAVEQDPSGRWHVLLNDGSEEPLDVSSLASGPDGAMSCRVKGGDRARFLRPAQAELLRHVEEKDGVFYLKAGGEFIPLAAE